MEPAHRVILAVLGKAPWPVPIDEIERQLGIGMETVRRELMRMERFGMVKSRKSPDDRVYTEWWPPDREEEFKSHLAIKGICGEWAY